jgi:hypothetical protein
MPLEMCVRALLIPVGLSGCMRLRRVRKVVAKKVLSRLLT